MTLLQLVKEGDFLAATLDLSLAFEASEWTLDSGVRCYLSHRGVLHITPAELNDSVKDLVISCGVHGDETGPIELVQQLAEQILHGRIEPKHRLLLIIAHPAAINAHTRFIVENMNRLFAARNDDSNVDRVMANQLQDAVDHFFEQTSASYPNRWHLDLHCAIRDSVHYTFAVSPYSENKTRNQALFAFLEQAEIEAILLSNSASPTFSWYSAEKFAAQALTVELGQVAALGENDLTQLKPFAEAMKKLVCESELHSQWRAGTPCVYRVTRTLVKQTPAFAFNFPAQQANFSFFEHGKLLAQDEGVEYFSLEGGEAIVFPNANVATGQRACLLVQQTEVVVGDQVTVKI
ncbi:succinylglutamate desuccinylase [Photobacterium lipolyticum]|uniref:Succinylglutamate desuccinylase n=1 Tax=Photobacterium lipolyticum TaxID=266810 RepID=A0A2T3N112_9GAMM|nr:succinylglutamate desuccinylase [Photobacterium lipolyticum]PSW06010.1 succinylglutamate desuccinylase [Photobacterium lipolyticum]